MNMKLRSIKKYHYFFFCLDSSVGRAKDWKSLCQWFKSTSRHFVYTIYFFRCYSIQLRWIQILNLKTNMLLEYSFPLSSFYSTRSEVYFVNSILLCKISSFKPFNFRLCRMKLNKLNSSSISFSSTCVFKWNTQVEMKDERFEFSASFDYIKWTP